MISTFIILISIISNDVGDRPRQDDKDCEQGGALWTLARVAT